MPPPLTDPYMPTGTIPNTIDAIKIEVFRYNSGTYKAFPNVQAIHVTREAGPHPSMAHFRYDLSYNDEDAPHTIEEAVSTTYDTPKPLTVIQGDRLLVKATKPDSTAEWLFDGRAIEFGTEMSGHAMEVFIGAVGIERDAWDTPLPGMYMRDADFPGAVSDHETDLPAHFNPKGAANASPDSADSGDATDGYYPVFLDPLVANFGGVGRKWTVAMATKYILFRYNKATKIKNPTASQIDDILVGKVPTGSAFDPNTPGTYTVKQLIAADTPITGRDWPTVLSHLLNPYGLGFYFELGSDGSGNPQTTLKLTGRQTGSTKVLMIQAEGDTLDRAYTNTSDAIIHRSLLDVANEWWVEGALKRYEISLVLACGYPSSPSDASDANTIKQYDSTDPSFLSVNADKYRLYIFDEAGEGHYAPGSTTRITTATDLSTIIDSDLVRRRKPLSHLLALDGKNFPMASELAISTNYTGTEPGVWDGTGTWSNIDHGWKLLKDRLGIRITVGNPNNWKISEANTLPGAAYPTGVLHAVEVMANTGTTKFHLRLTTTIEGDTCFRVKALKRSASPITRTILRKIDARDRYRKDIRCANSAQNTTGADIISRDDTEIAQTEADSVRYTTEMGVLQGRFVIDHITNYYKINDRLSKIAGRETGLRTDSGETGENPVTPTIRHVHWVFSPEQTTHLNASDAGADRGQYQRALHHGVRRG